jgi:hypothetical protein
MSLFDIWKNREYSNYWYDEFVKHVRSLVPRNYVLFSINIEHKKPWQEKERAFAIIIPPMHLLTGYSGKYIKKHNHEVIDTIYNQQNLEIHFISLNTFVDYLLDCRLDMHVIFKKSVKAWFIETGVSTKIHSLMKNCLAKSNLDYALYQLRLLNRDASTVEEMAQIIYEVGSYKYYLQRITIPSDYIIAVDFLNSEKIDDYIFVRKDSIDDNIKEYIEDEIVKLVEKLKNVNPKVIKSNVDMAHIFGFVQQFHLTYAKK